jgi:predicted MFS family arabinose efflux permease
VKHFLQYAIRNTSRFTFPFTSVKLLSVIQEPSKQRPLILQLVVLTLGRLFLNTGVRMVYPFLPELARGLGVTVPVLSRLITLRAFAGFLSPLFGPISERFGRRPVLAAALLLFGLGSFIVLIWPAYWPFGLALALLALAKVIYDPAMQAYLGDIVPYHQRGRALSVTELAWAGSWLVGAPAVGFLIQRQGWQAPFLWLGIGGLLMALVLWQTIPAGQWSAAGATTLRATLTVLRREPVIWAAAGYVLCAMAANETLLIVFGDWMERSFAAQLTTLGLASAVIGSAEVSGEISAGLAVDRFGKRPIVITTGILNLLMYLVIPFAGASLPATLAALFVLFYFFEITVVGGMPLLTEIVPQARAVVMTTVLAAGSLGRALGSLLGAYLWQSGDFTDVALAAGGLMFFSVFLLAGWVKEGKGQLPIDN